MKFKRLIKRFLAWIGAASMLLSLAGCAKQADESVIAKTNTEQIILLATAEEDAADPDKKETIKARIGAPDRLTWQTVAADGKLTVSIDAPVTVPEDDLPIVRVEPTNFSQETVDRAYQGLVGDLPMYETVYQRTKSELEKSLAYYRGVLADSSSSVPDKDFAQDYIDDIEAELAGAPESIAPVPGTSKLKRLAITVEGHAPIHYERVDLMSEDRQRFFSVTNDRDNTEPVTTLDVEPDGTVSGSSTITVARGAHMGYSVMTAGVRQGNGHDTIWINRDDPLPAYTAGLIQLTPAQAAAQVDDILARMGIADSFGISEINLCSDYHPGWGVPEATGYYYDIICTRRIGNTPCAPGEGSGNSRVSYWGSEELYIEINDSGVSYVSWTAPMNILETVSQAAQLRPFSEILEVAQKILPMEFEAEARDKTAQSLLVKIERVTLSLQRIVAQDDPFSGLLVPAWNFYGTRTITRTEGEFQNSSDFSRGSLLSINAIDGNIINVERGY